MSKVIITKLVRSNKTSKAGKDYVSLGIQVDDSQYRDTWINGFGNKDNEHWKVGDEVEITISQKVVGGKTYLNFESPKTSQKGEIELGFLRQDLTKINQKLDQIINHLSESEPLNRTSDGSPMPKL